MTPTSQELKQCCKLYRGERTNPYTPTDAPQNGWEMEYLKFHIWDAENAFVANYGQWLDMWQRSGRKDNESEIKGVYGFVVECKLMKMHREDIDFERMYQEL